MEKSKKNTAASVIYEWLDSFVFALIVVMIIFSFVLKSYVVDGVSMYPTLDDGSRVFAYSLFYTPKSGDIIVVDENNGYGAPLVKRVVATGGQTIDIDKETFEIYVDGELLSAPVAASADNLLGDTVFPVSVPEGFVFVMGDNRDESFDSRFAKMGLIDERSVLGKEIFEIKKR
ncbi:MAG: signal peptidase I [Ruminococcaceae bacterium]|nr:signal peptidase I [Oscillospiraceae bacterium]